MALVFGAREARPEPLTLSELNGANGLFAAIPNASTGIGAPRFAAGLGDINGDGYADALIGSSLDIAGSYVLYGRENFSGAVSYHTPGDDIIEVTATTPATTAVYAGAGDDRLFIGRSSFGSMTFGGSGNDTLIFTAERGQHVSEGGPGNDRYAVYGRHPSGLYEVRLRDDSGSNTLYLNVGAGGSILLRKGSVALDLGPEFPTIHLDDVDYNDVLGGPRTIDTVEFADGTSWSYATLIAHGFEIDGTALNDDLTGTSVVDRVNGQGGDDRLAGGRGDDQLRGGTGDDRYVIEVDGGADLIADEQGVDVLAWGPGIDPTQLQYASDGAALLISAPDQTVRIADWYHGLSARIERFQFGDSPTVDALKLVNHAPVAALALTPATARAGTPFTFTVPSGLFTDPDPFEELQVAVRDPLPAWLTFDAARGTLQGTPDVADAGTLNLNFLATDLVGATASAALVINVTVPLSNRPTAGADHLLGTAGHDRIAALAGDDFVRGEAGNDLLYGEAGRDTLEGGAGNDLLYGGNDADVLNGGPGNDLLVGGLGNDIYRFERGSGRDRVFEILSRDYEVVEFGAGLSARDLTFKRGFGGIEIGILGTQDTLSVGIEFPGFSPVIDEYRFADGTRLLAQDVSQLAQAMAGFAPIPSASNLFRNGDLALTSLNPLATIAAPLFHANA